MALSSKTAWLITLRWFEVKMRWMWSSRVWIKYVLLMKRAGCHTVFVGFESVNPKSLTETPGENGLQAHPDGHQDRRNESAAIRCSGLIRATIYLRAISTPTNTPAAALPWATERSSISR
jgi:hypothetical protein